MILGKLPFLAEHLGSSKHTKMYRSLQHARMEVHYETNGAFMEEGQLLKAENIAKIKHIPCSSSNDLNHNCCH
jgi:hypothetical protein